MKSIGHCLLLACLCFAVGGCASLRNGGAPAQSFNANDDLQALAKRYDVAAKLETFYAAPSKESRNELVTGRLAIYNIRYIEFIRDLGADKQALDSATDIVSLALNLAGTSTGALRAKSNLAGAAAGIGGTKTIIDKNYYFEKSIPVLIGAMNAQRKVVLVRILSGVKDSLDNYSITQAIDDLNDYYEAGTLSGALNGIQADSTTKEAKAVDDIKKLPKATPDQAATKGQVLARIQQLGESDFDAMKKVIAASDPAAPVPSTWQAAKDAVFVLHRAVTPDKLAAWVATLKAAGIEIGATK